ncbi:MAG: hypothetical protein Ct9H300mP16_03370 [Pseudomonadota bacterium]|nr:MAG: hypothetical protein Ct9H300mP16_03370 [Pseudomonadota bacterium]
MFQNLVCSADHEPASGFFSCPLLEISGCFSYQLIAPGPESDPEARAEMIGNRSSTLPGGRQKGILSITTPTSCGVSKEACQPVPYCAVRVMAASELPPTHSGNRVCTGRGMIEARSYWKNRPLKKTFFFSPEPAHDSSASFIRCPRPPVGVPDATKSRDRLLPSPKAGNRRPPER